ncbi:hypothetical protein CC86DRAFT_299202 [Ophiobolus disseminans]|uniref:Myb-like domain-containing protein n=1 Tax=Ophiobolus disseminans TaxID=1469910 RepID=A0A6A6ZSP6_9PLEO|nr:hypothetical protein CC86DRAFT_299202 [Ophiobolus disseminans]
MSAQPGYDSRDTSYPHSNVWGGSAVFGNGYALSTSLSLSPYTVGESDGASYSNNSLTYPESAAQGLVTNGNNHWGSLQSWRPSSADRLPCGTSANGSDRVSNSSLSPKSYTSELPGSEVQSFTPATTVETSSDSSTWAHGGGPSYVLAKVSSPKDAVQTARGVPNVDFYGRRQNGLGVPNSSPTPARTRHQFHGLPSPCENLSQYESDFSHSQQSSPGVAPWDLHDPAYSQAVLPYRPQVSQATSAPFTGLPNAYEPHDNNTRSYEVAAWSDRRANVPAQHHFQDRFQAPRTVDTQALRKADDEILLEGKRDGLTYKEIRKKMQAKPAESTLRGRYRSLTKPRQARVRKPLWRSIDVRSMNKIELLKQCVQQELDRIDANHHSSLGYDQRLGKVQWKKVADFIHANGGSYHFGNSTCKRKWTELNHGA